MYSFNHLRYVLPIIVFLVLDNITTINNNHYSKPSLLLTICQVPLLAFLYLLFPLIIKKSCKKCTSILSIFIDEETEAQNYRVRCLRSYI